MLFPFLSCVSTVILVWIIWSPLTRFLSLVFVLYAISVFIVCFYRDSCVNHLKSTDSVISFCIVCYFRFYRVFLPWFLCESFEVHWFLSLVFVLYAISVFIVCFYRDSCVNHFKSTVSTVILVSLVFVLLYAISVFILCFYRDSCVNHFKSTDSCH